MHISQTNQTEEKSVKKKRKSVVDASKELIIDTIVLSSEVLDSIHNGRPMPLDNVYLEPVEQSGEFAIRRQPKLLLVGICGLLALAAIALMLV
jgi:hypothetical protein